LWSDRSEGIEAWGEGGVDRRMDAIFVVVGRDLRRGWVRVRVRVRRREGEVNMVLELLGELGVREKVFKRACAKVGTVSLARFALEVELTVENQVPCPGFYSEWYILESFFFHRD